jgi:hypothetical protein
MSGGQDLLHAVLVNLSCLVELEYFGEGKTQTGIVLCVKADLSVCALVPAEHVGISSS